MRMVWTLLGFLLLGGTAQAQNCSVPNTFINGTIIDANQVNANFAALTNCATNSVHVATTAALAASSSATYPNGVWRDDFSTGLGAPPLFYVNSGSACSLPDNGAQVTSSDGKCWVARFPGGGADIREWGAACNNSTDDTAAINLAFASAIRTLLMPAGSCRVTTLNAPQINTVLRGVSEDTSLLVTTAATGDVLPLTHGGVHLNRIGFNTAVTRTAGCYFHMSANGLLVQNFFMSGAFCAFKVDDNTSSNFIDYGNITASVGASQDLITYGSGTSTGAVAQYFGHTIINSGTPPTNNIALVNVGDLVMDNIQSIGAAGANLAIKPGSSQSVLTLKTINSFFDSGAVGMSVGPTGTGIVGRSQFVNTFFGDGTTNGAVLDGGTGSALVDGLQFTNCQFVNVPSGSGLVVQNRVEHTTITDSLFAGNSNGVFDNRSSTTPGLYISNSIIGQGGSFGGNGQGFAGNGAGDYLILMNNWMGANSGVAYGSTNTGTHNVVENNAGYNPVGTSVVTVTASPFTFTNGPTHSVYYSFGGTISSITVNGVSLINVAASPWVIPLAPNDVVVTTYTVAPTVHNAVQ